MEKVIVSKSEYGNGWYYTMPCIICDESVKLTDEEYKMMQAGHRLRSRVCDKCKQAVLHMRDRMNISKVSDDNKEECNDKSDIFVITKHSFDEMENEVYLARHSVIVGYAESEEQAKQWISSQESRTYVGWDHREYPYYTIQNIHKVE